MSLLLKDPRKFSNIYPDSNMLINQAQADLSAGNDSNLMVALIEDLLKREQDEFLSIAYNLAPTKQIADYIWDSLQVAVNQGMTKLFAIPLALVIGSGSKINIPARVDEQKLQQLMLEKHIFTNSKNTYISGKLFSLDHIVKLKPSFLANPRDVTTLASDHPLFVKEVTDIENLGESVYLRFLLGFANSIDEETFMPINFSKIGLELMQLLSDELKANGATVFPIPFPPCRLSEAAYLGERYRKEIHISLRLSNQVRKMRQSGGNPQIKLRTVDETIKVELWEATSMKAIEVINWNLERGDDFDLVCSILNGLFIDMQLVVSYE